MRRLGTWIAQVAVKLGLAKRTRVIDDVTVQRVFFTPHQGANADAHVWVQVNASHL